MSKNRHRFSLPQRAPRAPAQNAPLHALAPKLGVAAAAAKQAQPAAAPLCHSVAHYYNAAGELINAPIAAKAAQ